MSKTKTAQYDGSVVFYPPTENHKLKSWTDDQSVSLFGSGPYAGGSHIQKPKSFETSDRGLNMIDPHELVGECRVVEVGDHDGHIESNHIEDCGIEEGERVLLKTRASSDDYSGEFIHISPQAITKLGSLNTKCLGLDTITTTDEHRHIASESVHFLQSHGIPYCEGIDLKNVEPGNYFLVMLPREVVSKSGASATMQLLSMD
jgi:arylformamidase